MRSIIGLASLLAMAACSPGVVEVPLDQDGDGLMSDLEMELGTDPFSADSDGDGYADGEEYSIGTDPTDLFDRPYVGGWPMDKCADTVVGTGHQIGETVEDFQLQDQYGDLVRMYDFCNHTVLLVESAFGWGGCLNEAPELEAWYQNYADEGLLIVTLFRGTDITDAQNWALESDLTFPVLVDVGSSVGDRYYNNRTPASHLVGPGMELITVNEVMTKHLLEDYIADLMD